MVHAAMHAQAKHTNESTEAAVEGGLTMLQEHLKSSDEQ